MPSPSPLPPAHSSPSSRPAPSSPSTPPGADLPQQVRDEARRLHRQLRSGRLADALPLLRRLLAAGVLPPAPLPRLFERREQVQRKHLLNLLGREAGHADWATFADALRTRADTDLGPLTLAWQRSAELNLWFSRPEAAQAHAAQHGGRAVAVGVHGVVLPASPAGNAAEAGDA